MEREPLVKGGQGRTDEAVEEMCAAYGRLVGILALAAVVVIVLVLGAGLLASLGCYSKTYTMTGTDVVIYSQELADGSRTLAKVPTVVTRSWTKRYLFKPGGFPSEILDDPFGAAKMMHETQRMRDEAAAKAQAGDPPRLEHGGKKGA